MSRNRHMRKALLVGIVDRINSHDEEFSFQIKIQPKWIDDTGEEKLGRSIEADIVLDDLPSIQRYKNKITEGTVVQIEGELKNLHSTDEQGMKKKKLVIAISKFDGNIAILNIKKESDIPYINKIFIVGNATNVRVTPIANGKTMGIFTLVTKKSWKDKITNTINQSDEWLDVFVFNEMILRGFNEGSEKLSNKTVIVEANLQSIPSKDGNEEKRNTIAVAKRNDNRLILLDVINTNLEREGEKSHNDWKKTSNESPKYHNNNQDNPQEGSTTIDDDHLPF